MYDLNRRVYVKSLGQVGRVAERNYIGRPRRASYLIDMEGGGDFLTGSGDLRSADYVCDGCGEWREGAPLAHARVVLGDGSVDDEFRFCFLCAGPPASRRASSAYNGWQ